MTKTSYAENNIFTNKQLNVVCDTFLKAIVDKFTSGGEEGDDVIYRAFILSGRASAMLQDAVYDGIKNIVFQTSNPDIFEYLKVNIFRFFDCKTIAFADRIILYPLGFYFEIWFSPDPMTELEISNIYLQHIDFIPEETL